MDSEYWKKVGARLAYLGKAAVNAAIPAVVMASINTAYEHIEAKLHELFLKTIRNSAITLALNAAGVLILIFQSFEKTFATWLSLIFFFSYEDSPEIFMYSFSEIIFPALSQLKSRIFCRSRLYLCYNS